MAIIRIKPTPADEAARMLCPCCGKYSFTEKDAYEICPVCGWEDDRIQRQDPSFAGGANKLSLWQARGQYKRISEESK